MEDITFFEPLNDKQRPIGDETKNLTLAAMNRDEPNIKAAQDYEKQFFKEILDELGPDALKEKRKKIKFLSNERNHLIFLTVCYHMITNSL